MDNNNQIRSVVNSIFAFILKYFSWEISGIIFVLLVILIIRIWPDRAVILFIRRNVRVTSQKLKEVREHVADAVGTEIYATQKAIADQQIKAQALRLEVIRLQQTVNVKSISMLVGKKLIAIEKDYIFHLKNLQSEQAREALRRVTEKEINDLLRSVNVDSSSVPEFHFNETNADLKRQ